MHHMSVLDRFLRYVAVDTRSDEQSTICPSTPGQLVLMRMLAAELRAIGLDDVSLDEHGYSWRPIPGDDSAGGRERARRSASSRTSTRRRKCPART